MIDLTVRSAIVGAVVKHVLVQRLTVNGQAFGPGLADGCHPGGGADMHHVERCPRHAFRQPEDAAERQVFRQRVVDLARFSKPTRPSRMSLPYICMTMSLSSAW